MADNDHFQDSKLLSRPLDPSSTRANALRRAINRKHGLQLKDIHDLHSYSISDYTFWLDLWEFLGIVSSVPPTKVIEPGQKPYLPRWFPGTRLNYAENLLSRSDDGVAIVQARETGSVQNCSWRQLRLRVTEIAGGLRAAGVKIGDRVAGIISNSIDSVALALAVAAVGAIFSCTAPDMGSSGILERYRQIQPVVIFAETEVMYAGKVVGLVPKVTEVANDLRKNGLRGVVLFPSVLSGKVPHHELTDCVSIEDFIKKGKDIPMVFEQLPFNHPLYILYSSGTSGPPKCIVHSAGGVLVQTMKDLALGFNMNRDQTYFQYTTTGWMMWPYMISGLALGVTIVAYDGSPFYPDLREFLKFVDKRGVSVLGISPRFLTEVQGRGIHPLDLAPFDCLRAVFSTGAVLTPPMFEFAQQAFGPNVHIASGSGGTDICCGFVGAILSEPVYAGEIQGKSLGMAVEIFDPEGKNIEHTGQPGELVCTRPHPSLPVCFWNDKDGEKFRKAYFDMYPGIWRQGDFIVRNPKTKGLMILGRSDGVLNPSGVRFGSGEIYAVLERSFSNIFEDTLCIGQRRPQKDKDERVLLFVKMRNGLKLTNEMKAQVKEAIRTGLSIRHVPAHIFEVADIPVTVNNKKIEIAVKQIVSGTALKPSGTVANPESLELYRKYFDLEGVLAAESGNAKPKL
ncbi:acetoacetyl-CoA synthetase [Schizopora paradoxa]|uniref:Acetoacetyl-CoA synthetase n=1 Tax=Schizopora paradoxa TaxID=27342 RepID=A0A0H2S0F9_9AGAM|nr:acetoacetyl-CoA synthetase [Schizopora paradoxa]